MNYWSLLKNWLSEILPRTKEIDAFVFAGGSYDLLHSYFTDYVRFLEAESLYTDSAKQLKNIYYGVMFLEKSGL